MRRFGVLVLTCVLGIGLGSRVGAQQDEGSEDSQADSGKDTTKDAKPDPWTAPNLPKEPPPAEPVVGQPVLPVTYPSAEIDRPFSLLPLVLEPRLDVIFDFMSQNNVDNNVSMRFGAGFGIVDQLEAGTSFPLRFAPEVDAGDLEFYGLYDLSSLLGDLMKLAARMRFAIPLSNDYSYWQVADSAGTGPVGADFAMLVDVLAKYKIIDLLAMVGDVGMGFGLFPGDDVFLLFFHAGALVQPLPALAIVWTVGFEVYAGQDHTSVPMHLWTQYTLFGDLDMYLDLAFPDLNHLGADWFQMVVGAAYRLGF